MRKVEISSKLDHPILVLSREVSEGIYLQCPCGQRIYVAVSELRGEKVRIAVQADRQVTVLREELVQ